RQMNCRLGSIDGEHPTVPGHVPIELVIAGEKSDLAAGAIRDQIAVLAWIDHRVGVADTHPGAVRNAFDRVGFGMAVAHHSVDVETHSYCVAGAVAVERGKITEDAMLDAIAFGLDN